MRRLLIGCAAAALLVAGGAVASSSVAGATTAPPDAVHPVVGAWQLTVDEFPGDPPSLVAFHADGTYQEADSDGTVGIGSWEATGPSSVNLTFMAYVPDDESAPMQTIRATGEVSADGQTFTAQFTIEFTGAGAPSGEFGPGHATATRIAVEPMGTPAGSLDDLFSQFEQGTEPMGTESMGTESMTTTPMGTESMGTESMTTTPMGTESMTTTPMGTESMGTESMATESMATTPMVTESAGTM
jgi:hypothetical protein